MLGNHVVVGSGAKVLGNIELGEWVKVGAGSVVVNSVPAHATVVGIPGRVVAVKGVSVSHDEWQMLEHGELPDPVGQTLANLNERLSLIEAEVSCRYARAGRWRDVAQRLALRRAQPIPRPRSLPLLRAGAVRDPPDRSPRRGSAAVRDALSLALLFLLFLVSTLVGARKLLKALLESSVGSTSQWNYPP